MQENSNDKNQETINQTPAKSEATKSNNTSRIIAIIMTILAIAGIGFGVYSFMDSNNKSEQIKSLESNIGTLKKTIEEKEDAPTTESEGEATILPKLGISVKNLEADGTITDYHYQRTGGAPDEPIALAKILYMSGVPDVATDFITGISGATIYQYDSNYFFDPKTECDVDLGKIGESEYSYCVKKLPAESNPGDGDAWMTWADSNVEKIMKVLSDKTNYSAL